MPENLYQYFIDQTWKLTENWYDSLDKGETKGVYSSTDPFVIEIIKQQNYEFHKRFSRVFIDDELDFERNFEDWIIEIAEDEQHLNTPIHHILKEFFRTQEQYLDLFYTYIREYPKRYSKDEENRFLHLITDTYAKVITWFTREHFTYSERKLQAQQELIHELSTPIIKLNHNTAILPLIGDIDTTRSKRLVEHTLEQCARKKISHLFIDLSGVMIVDTMVAAQLFQVIESLRLIGVQSTLSGIRPEIAQTAVQLGIDFTQVTISSTLEHAINLNI
ncbi:RsbT co-antagonist protein RsbRB [Bacillus coahuilensis m2-6]|uniref:RsbT co-antagonist protein RsbRB n=1 Tax=Bacillus coahuilensis p1.1.43 TaxID=1150625 RepID=A0A147K686_9BACI|nr:STAS domain-containing protein [Bacillus coahuilensis]KUP05373.1 RsbT co-antagonist protein RsbRB [Bacillus coahuilensis p1.1.43]KUP06115.1 RsbT co-antagonist protein RsbRB [Bacillus coahuilensis m2-6]